MTCDQQPFVLVSGDVTITVSAEGVMTHYPVHGTYLDYGDDLLAAFRGGVWRHNVPHSEAFDVHLRIASLLDPSPLSPVDQRRLLFLRHFRPERVTPSSFAYDVPTIPGNPPRSFDLELTPDRLLGATPLSGFNARKLHMPDEIFFLGPIEPGMPLALRRSLRSALFSALDAPSGLSLDDAFPLLDHGSIEPRSWTLASTAEGSDDAVVSGGVCSVGYQYRQDYGVQDWSVERAVTSPETLGQAPTALRLEIVSYLLRARLAS